MVRKILLSAAGVMLVGGFLFGKDAVSYVSTAFSKVKSSVKDSVPIEFEIDRARQMVKDLVPEIRKNIEVIAKEEVEVERLDRQIKEAEQRQDKDRNELMRLKTDAASGKSQFTYGSRTYTITQVKADLSNRFERYKTSDATLASLKEMLATRQKGVDTAKVKLETMLASKRKLEVDVENLEARLKSVELANAQSDRGFDDSQLSHVKELVSDLRVRLDVAAKMVNADTQVGGQIQLDPVTPANIVDQVAEYFGDGGKLAAHDGE